MARWWDRTARPVSQPWAVEQPSQHFLLEYLLVLSLISIGGTLAFKSLQQPARFVESCGVKVRRVARTMQEIDRKAFHLATLLVPIIHNVLLSMGWTNEECVHLCWVITIGGWTADLARVFGPDTARRWFPLQRLLREKEKGQITGGCYLSLGCTLTMAISPPSITMASILFLVLGDLSAAIVGVSFGKETVSLKLGREGKKSAEGSSAGWKWPRPCLTTAPHLPARSVRRLRSLLLIPEEPPEQLGGSPWPQQPGSGRRISAAVDQQARARCLPSASPWAAPSSRTSSCASTRSPSARSSRR
eukprot:Transcript_6949.p1 GENE.Transcript_6949~~Transcript_6949.p1  ORF type:complete len:303 (-),score=67.44 Transcript_6949:453-1361(-)